MTMEGNFFVLFFSSCFRHFVDSWLLLLSFSGFCGFCARFKVQNAANVNWKDKGIKRDDMDRKDKTHHTKMNNNE